jgi:maleylacetoacetate isomerase
MKLHTFFRSSAAYRARIALNLKGLAYQQVAWKISAGEHQAERFRSVSPQGLVPALDDGGVVIAQSLALIEYLDETHPAPPLLPADPAGRAQVRSMALAIACDIHPLNNLRVLNRLKQVSGFDEAAVNDWYRHWVAEGFRGLEELASRHSSDGRHLYGAAVTLADVCLVPQMYNARRFDCDLAPYPRLRAITTHLESLPAFAAALPEAQPDAPK